MVAIVTGLGLGLERSSAFVLGSRGKLGDATVGRLGTNVTINAATGNLVIQNQDEILIGLGPDNVLSRSYNSLGLMNDDNGDNWRESAQRSVVLASGTINTAGSMVKRMDWDGSEIAFSWDSALGAYVSKEGGGAFDVITFAANTFSWTDGNSRTVEKYDSLNGGRITSTADRDGNQITYGYTSGKLTRVTTASGEYTELVWTGNNLTQLTTRSAAGAIIAARTRYSYDASNRLSTVTTDLSPGDNSVADGKVTSTTYTYDGTSKRIASISESGSDNFVTFTYIQVGTDYRIASVTEAMFSDYVRTTNFSYDTANGRTTVTDTLGKATILAYDANGNLTSVTYPPAATGVAAQVVRYTYNTNGDVTSATDALGQMTSYTYDVSGNLTESLDAAGQRTRYEYNTANQIVKTVIVSNTTGLRQLPGTGVDAAYYSATYPAVSVGGSAFDPLLDYNTVGWQAGRNPNGGFNTSYYLTQNPDVAAAGINPFQHYLEFGWREGRSPASGVTTAEYIARFANQTTRYAYDSENHLRFAVTPDGKVTEYRYNGAGLQVSAISYTGNTYNVGGLASTANLTEATMSAWVAGLGSSGAFERTDTAYDFRGNVSSTIDYSDLNINRVRFSQFEQGSNGWLTWGDEANMLQGGLVTGTDAATGKKYIQQTFKSTSTSSFMGLYSASYSSIKVTPGERLAVRAGVGATAGVSSLNLSVQFFDANGQLIGASPQVGWKTGAQAFNTVISGFVDVPANAAEARLMLTANAATLNSNITVTLTEPMLTQAAADQTVVPDFVNSLLPTYNSSSAQLGSASFARTNYIYDQFGLLLSRQAVGIGTAEAYTYDGLGRVLTATDFAGATTTTAFNDGTRVSAVTLANGMIKTSTFTAQGELWSYTESGSGVTSETENYRYDKLGRLRFTQDAVGFRDFTFFDDAGRKTGEMDRKGGLTEYRYDAANRLVATIFYANLMSASAISSLYDAGGNPTNVTIASVRPASTYNDRWEWNVYDGADRIVQKITTVKGGSAAQLAAVTTYTYDGVGRLIQTVDSANLLTPTVVAGFMANPPGALNRVPNAQFDGPWGWLASTSTAGLINAGMPFTGIANGKSYIRANFTSTAAGQVASMGTNGSNAWIKVNAGERLAVRVGVEALGAIGTINVTVEFRDISGNVISTSTIGQLSGPQAYDTKISGFVTAPAGAFNARVIVNMTSSAAGTGSFNIIEPMVSLAAASQTTFPSFDAAAIPNTTNDRMTRNFYSDDGQLIGTVDGNGSLQQFAYDQAGRLIKTVSYANFASQSARTNANFETLLAAVGSSAADRTEYLVYNGQGQIRYRLDGNWRPTEYVYDRAGQVIRTIDYGASIASGNLSDSYVQGQITNLNLLSDAATRVSRNIYDEAGRLVYQIDAEGYVTHNVYNSVSQIVRVERRAVRYTVADDPSLATITGWEAANVNAGDRKDRAIYDSLGRLVYEVDAGGYVTEHQYDLNDRVLKDIRYPASYTISDTATASGVATQIGALPAGAVVTTYAYDKAGNLIDRWDGLNNRTHYDYNAFDQVSLITQAYGTSAAVSTSFGYDSAGRIVSKIAASGTADQASTSYGYDGVGNLLSETDARGNVVVRSYDAVGNVLTQSVPLDGTTNAVTSYQYDAFGNIVKRVDPRADASYNYYDKLNRLTLTIDTEGYATQTSYTIGNEIASVKHYYLAASNIGSVTTVPTLTANARDATTSFLRDKLGRVTQVTDAEGYYEQYTLNAFGDRLTVRNKLGGVTNNIFDARGLLLQETLPVGSTRVDGTLQAANIVNKFEYDGRGNRTKMIEAFGLTEQRVTAYEYDKLDRLTKTTREQVTILSASTMATSSSVPVEAIVYDARGNVIETKDANGARTLFYYDALDRKIMEISAVGTVSKWTYDANGNALTARVYGDLLTLPATAGGSAPTPVNVDNYRLTSFVYDKANRLTSSTIGGAVVAGYNAGQYVYTTNTSIVTQNIYNTNGDVVQQIDGNGRSTFFYYDKLGRKIAQIDAGNYLTSYDLDADGNVLKEKKFATKLTVTPAISSNLASLISGADGDNPNNRVTTFTYDKNGRRLTESRGGVEAWQVDGTTGAMTTATGIATVTYAYNGLGLVVSKAEATGDKTTYAYDVMGRQTGITGATFTDQAGASVANAQVTSYNGLNSATRTVENGARISTFTYGTGGRLISSVDANGNGTSYYYDAVGHLSATTYVRVKADGTTITEAQSFQYDAVGRQAAKRVFAIVNNAWVTAGDSNETYYNSYGDIIAKGVNSAGNVANAQEFAKYDQMGRVWLTNFGDGVTKAYAYDANGNATMLLQTAGAVDLQTRASIVDIFSDLNNGTAIATISLYDARNQVIDTIQAQATNEGANPIHAVQDVVTGQGHQYFSGGANVSSTSNYAATGVSAANVSSNSVFVANKPGYYQLSFGPSAMATFSSFNSVNNGGGKIHIYARVDGEYTDAFGDTFPVSYESDRVFDYTQNPINVLVNSATVYYSIYISVYQELPNGGVTGLVSGSFSGYMNETVTNNFGDKLQIQNENPNVTATQIWYRPWGSSGFWTHLGAGTQMIPGWFNQDLNGLTNGQYEIWVQGYNAAGNLYDNKTFWLHDGIADLVSAQPAVGGPAGAALGRYYDNGNQVDILTFSGLPTSTTQMTMRWRTIGSSTWNVINPTNGGWGQNGYWFTNVSGWGSNIEYWIEPKDGNGNLVAGKIYGQFSVGGQVVNRAQYYDLPENVSLSPPTGQNVTSQQFRVFKNGAWQPWATYGAGGVWVYDTSGLVPDRYYSYSYQVEYETYGPSGLLSRSAGTLSVGYNGRAVNLAPTLSSNTAKVQFSPYSQPSATLIKLYWRDRGSTGGFQPVTIAKTSAGFAWDVENVRPGSGSREIEYYYDAYDANGSLLPTATGADHSQGYVTIYSDRYVDTANRETRWVIDPAAQSSYLVHRSQQYNAFGEIVSETDGNGNTTEFTYNTEGKLLSSKAPQVLVTGENGVSTLQRPTEYYYYDLSGRQIGQRDANGNLTTQKLLAGAGYGGGKAITVAEFRPDGSKTRYGIDVFGNVRTITDGLNNVTLNSYDNLNNLTQVIHPARVGGNSNGAQLTDYYSYDILGQRIKHWNSQLGASYVESTDYDAQGRVTKTVSLGGLVTKYDHYYHNGSEISTNGLGNFGGWQTITTNSAGLVSYDNIDIFGRLSWRQDFGGRWYSYLYDEAGRLVQQVNMSGQNVNYAYYKNGYIKSITDNNLGMRASFAYDNEGNRVQEDYNSTDGNPRFYENSTITYDAMNRITRILDPKADITYKYDAVGNRRNVKSIYTDGLGNSIIAPQDYWYKYDSLNRFVQTMGALSGSTIVNGTEGAVISYDAAGNRATATYGSDGHTETYSYTADGYLENTTIGGIVRAKRTNDAMGRVIRYDEYDGNGANTLTRISTYDRDNRVLTENLHSLSGGVWTNNNQIFDYKAWNGSSYAGADQGVVTHIQSQQFLDTSPSSITTSQTNYYYQWWDSAKQSEIRVAASNPANPNSGNWAPGLSKLTYDVNGHIKQLDDVSGNRTVKYQNDAYGQVLVREEWANNVLGPRQLYYYFNGNRVGDVGNNGPAASRVDYATALAQSEAGQGANNAGKGNARSGAPVASADFDQSFQPINGGYPGAASSYYTVATGDTLRSIAQRIWGDSAFWYLIADANGLTNENILVAGLRLVIPNKVANAHNNTTTFRPYDPGEAIGDTLPTLPPEPAMPAPAAKNGGCGVFGKVLLAAVAVAVTIIALPAAPATASFAQGALAAALGSVASQGVGLVTGIQNKFSFANVALAAIGGGVSAGLAPGGFSKLGSFSWAGTTGGAVLRGVAGSLATQGIGVATGLQKQFDWAGVAAAGVGGAVRGIIKGGSDFGTQLSRSTADLLASAAAHSLVSGNSFGNSVNAVLPSVLGNTIGNMAADAVASSGSATSRPLSSKGVQLAAGDPSQVSGLAGQVGEFWDEAKQWGADAWDDLKATGVSLRDYARARYDSMVSGGAEIIVNGYRSLSMDTRGIADAVSATFRKASDGYGATMLLLNDEQRRQSTAPLRPIVEARVPLGVMMQANTTGNLPSILLPQSQSNIPLTYSYSVADLAMSASAIRGGRVGSVSIAAESRGVAPLQGGVAHEAERLAQLGIPKNNAVWRPGQADFDSAAFKVIVGEPKFTRGGLPKGTIFDGTMDGNLEIKGGASMLDSSYQLRLQTYRSLKTNTPLTIETTRPINPAFQSWLDRWGVSAARPK